MKIINCVPVFLSLLCALSTAQAQGGSTGHQTTVMQTPGVKSKREIVQEEKLSKLLSRVGVSMDAGRAASDQPQAYREMKIRWTGQTGAQTDASTTSTIGDGKPGLTLNTLVLDEKTRPGTLPRQRSLELSPTQILIAAVDENNQLRWWSIQPDPRIVRAETQSPDGELRSQDFYLADLTLVVAFPEDPAIVNLRFYHPAWNGTAFDLQLLAVTPVR
jgi:outer membrane protein assembly factor BamB